MSWTKTSHWGDYSDSKQNHKQTDYNNSNSLKYKLGFSKHGGYRHRMSKRYADNHQKL